MVAISCIYKLPNKKIFFAALFDQPVFAGLLFRGCYSRDAWTAHATFSQRAETKLREIWWKVILYVLTFKRRLIASFLIGRAFVYFVLVWMFIQFWKFNNKQATTAMATSTVAVYACVITL